MTSLLLFLAAMWAGAQNALAGGGAFVTLPALLLAGLDPVSANVTSTVALVPSQFASAYAGRALVIGPPGLPVGRLLVVAAVGGLLGAVLLLVTPVALFTRLIPWLVLFATLVFAHASYGSSLRRQPVGGVVPRPGVAALLQGLIAVYGGYFGGGIGFMILAVLMRAGVSLRSAGATKNALAATINATAVLVFVLSPAIRWDAAAPMCAGAIIGGVIGTWGLRRLPERWLRAGIVVLGLVLTVALFLR